MIVSDAQTGNTADQRDHCKWTKDIHDSQNKRASQSVLTDNIGSKHEIFMKWRTIWSFDEFYFFPLRLRLPFLIFSYFIKELSFFQFVKENFITVRNIRKEFVGNFLELSFDRSIQPILSLQVAMHGFLKEVLPCVGHCPIELVTVAFSISRAEQIVNLGTGHAIEETGHYHAATASQSCFKVKTIERSHNVSTA